MNKHPLVLFFIVITISLVLSSCSEPEVWEMLNGDTYESRYKKVMFAEAYYAEFDNIHAYKDDLIIGFNNDDFEQIWVFIPTEDSYYYNKDYYGPAETADEAFEIHKEWMSLPNDAQNEYLEKDTDE